MKQVAQISLVLTKSPINSNKISALVYLMLITILFNLTQFNSVVAVKYQLRNFESSNELPEDCDEHDQYYDLSEEKCRNCSDVIRLLYEVYHQDWTKISIGSGSGGGGGGGGGDGDGAAASHLSESGRADNSGVSTEESSGISAHKLAKNGTGNRSNQRRDFEFDSPDAILSRLIATSERPQISELNGDDSDDGGGADSNSASEILNTDYSSSDSRDYSTASTNHNRDQSIASGHPEIDGIGIGIGLEDGSNVNDINLINRKTIKSLNKFIKSDLIHKDFIESVRQCKQNQNSTACQMWSNICVLSLYSHSTVDSMPSKSSSSYRKSSPMSMKKASNKNRLQASKDDSFYRLSWQDCPQFTISSICGSLREWHRTEKSNLEVANIFANDDEPLNNFGSSISMRNNQKIQLLAYIYSYTGQLIKVNQFDLNDMEKFCPIYPSGMKSISRQIEDAPHSNTNTQQQRHLRVGQSMQMKCQFNPIQLFDYYNNDQSKNYFETIQNETVFVNLFIGHQQPNGAMYVKPVPILIRNLMFNGQQINRKYNQDSSRWKLVHRFFYKSVYQFNERSRISKNNNDNHGNIETYLIYAKSVEFDLKFKKQERGSLLLSSLLLNIDYALEPLKPIKSAATNKQANITDYYYHYERQLESSVLIKQTLVDMQNYKKNFELMITFVCILSGIWSLIKCYNIQKCHGLVKLDIYSLILFILISCNVVSNLLALSTLCVVIYLFLVLKFQIAGIQVFAPTDELEATFLINLQLALALKFIGLVYKLYVQLNADIFFIDWERPKMLTSAQILNNNRRDTSGDGIGNTLNKSSSNHQDQSSRNNNETAIASHGSRLAPSLSASINQQQQTSFWRPYTVINRWIELQGKQRLNLTIQLIVFVLFIESIQLGSLSSTIPNWDTFRLFNGNGNSHNQLQQQPRFGVQVMMSNLLLHYQQKAQQNQIQEATLVPHLRPCTSMTFRLLLLALIYLFLATIQFIYRKYFHEQMIRNPISEFIDLCSVANVSLFSMLYPRYGFYIHGRNANGSGDCSILEMNSLFEREERDLCSKRGLLPESDHQTFVMILPRIVNDHYRRLLFHDEQVAFNQMGNKQFVDQFNYGGNFSTKFNLQTPLQLVGASSGWLASQSTSPQLGLFGCGQARMQIEVAVARNKAINLFLANFIDHIYKDIDYTIREKRRFESILMDIDFGISDEATTIGGGGGNSLMPGVGGIQTLSVPQSPLVSPTILHHPIRAQQLNGNGTVGDLMATTKFNGTQVATNTATAATFCLDRQNSFTSLLWFGIELDIILIELFALLTLDFWLGQPELIVIVSLVWLIQKSFKQFYLFCARNNLITKSMLDEKFLARL